MKQLPDFKSSEERDRFFLENSDYFTVIRKTGVGTYERSELKNLEYAQKVAEMKRHLFGGNYLIYAVIGSQSALVQTVGG